MTEKLLADNAAPIDPLPGRRSIVPRQPGESGHRARCEMLKLETPWDDDEEEDVPHRREEDDDTAPDEDDSSEDDDEDDEEPLRTR